uniref:Uncharacterized protein n=1 Tax=Gadus morhua TaxID=8049 RepID=A0A8C5AR61_GADMO
MCRSMTRRDPLLRLYLQASLRCPPSVPPASVTLAEETPPATWQPRRTLERVVMQQALGSRPAEGLSSVRGGLSLGCSRCAGRDRPGTLASLRTTMKPLPQRPPGAPPLGPSGGRRSPPRRRRTRSAGVGPKDEEEEVVEEEDARKNAEGLSRILFLSLPSPPHPRPPTDPGPDPRPPTGPGPDPRPPTDPGPDPRPPTDPGPDPRPPTDPAPDPRPPTDPSPDPRPAPGGGSDPDPRPVPGGGSDQDPRPAPGGGSDPDPRPAPGGGSDPGVPGPSVEFGGRDVRTDVSRWAGLEAAVRGRLAVLLHAADGSMQRRLARVSWELARTDTELLCERAHWRHLARERQEAAERQRALSRQVDVAVSVIAALREQLNASEDRLEQREREALSIQSFLAAAARQEASGRLRLQRFIEALLERIALAERRVRSYQGEEHADCQRNRPPTQVQTHTGTHTLTARGTAHRYIHTLPEGPHTGTHTNTKVPTQVDTHTFKVLCKLHNSVKPKCILDY